MEGIVLNSTTFVYYYYVPCTILSTGHKGVQDVGPVCRDKQVPRIIPSSKQYDTLKHRALGK